MSSQDAGLALGLAVAAFAFPAVAWVCSRLAAWPALARAYPASPGDRPQELSYGSAVFRGWVAYNNALRVGASERGLYVATLPVLLSWCHPAVFIPWSDIVEVREAAVWPARFGPDACLVLGRLPGFAFRLRARPYRLIRPRLSAARVRVTPLKR